MIMKRSGMLHWGRERKMYFNSLDFAIFFPVVFILYWFVTGRNLKAQNFVIVAASYVFYGWWDWRFLSLIIFSTFVDYFISLFLDNEKSESKRKYLLFLSMAVNLGLLGFFKYFNFFIDSFCDTFLLLGKDISPKTLNIILPVGISFYTFQTMSYTIDVYKRKLKPTNDFTAFAAFVSFFPQLVAGPIERASNLLPQFYEKRKFDYINASDGMRQILWGLLKKVVIADNCAEYANLIFNNSSEMNGSSLILGAFFFSLQIYGDFSGYSDIAIGTSKLFGFELKRNFAYPYFSRDIAEFWRRWHISLSSWFRDYVYIPLGGSHGGLFCKIRNTFIIFILSGFWHGADWTFIFWGALNALFFLPILISGKNRNNMNLIAEGRLLPDIKDFLSILSTFILVMFTWIFFRAENISHAFSYIAGIFSPSVFSIPDFPGLKKGIFVIILTFIFLLVEWFGRNEDYAIKKLSFIKSMVLRYAVYFVIVLIIYFYDNTSGNIEFIYFQF